MEAYTPVEYEALQKESKRITNENKLSQKRSKYAQQRTDKRWMEEEAQRRWEGY